MRAVEVAAPLDRFLHVVAGHRVENAEPVVHLLAVLDHGPLHGEDVALFLEADRVLVLPHQIGGDDEVHVVDPLQRLQPAGHGSLLADEVIGRGIEPPLGRDVQDVRSLAAVVEEAADGAGHEPFGLAEDLRVLLVRPDAGRLVVRALLGHAEERGDAGLDLLQRDIPIPRRLDVYAWRFVETRHWVLQDVCCARWLPRCTAWIRRLRRLVPGGARSPQSPPPTKPQKDSPPPLPFDASLIRLLISEISWIQLCRSLCSISRMSSRDQ